MHARFFLFCSAFLLGCAHFSHGAAFATTKQYSNKLWNSSYGVQKAVKTNPPLVAGAGHPDDGGPASVLHGLPSGYYSKACSDQDNNFMAFTSDAEGYWVEVSFPSPMVVNRINVDIRSGGKGSKVWAKLGEPTGSTFKWHTQPAVTPPGDPICFGTANISASYTSWPPFKTDRVKVFWSKDSVVIGAIQMVGYTSQVFCPPGQFPSGGSCKTLLGTERCGTGQAWSNTTQKCVACAAGSPKTGETMTQLGACLATCDAAARRSEGRKLLMAPPIFNAKKQKELEYDEEADLDKLEGHKVRQGTQVASADFEAFHEAAEQASARRSGTTVVPAPKWPLCGATKCDNADVAQSYYDGQGTAKVPTTTVRVKIVNFAYDDGSKPVANASDLTRAMNELKAWYAPGGITVKHTIHTEKSTLLTQRVNHIVVLCEKWQIGDGTCQNNCNKYITGFDGGDCATSNFDGCTTAEKGNGVCNPGCNTKDNNWDNGDCYARKGDQAGTCAASDKGNGVCNPVCNTKANGYDGGDCCTGANAWKSCFDPSHANLAWYNIVDLKKKLNMKNDKQANLILFNFIGGTSGTAVMPWNVQGPGGATGVQGGALSWPGGIAMGWNKTAGGITLPHELGHSLGLYHSFQGTSVACTDKCYEFTSSFAVGDLVKDTPPDFKDGCKPPISKCMKTGLEWNPTPLYNNVMSYHMCVPGHDMTFTKGQFARMKCYLHQSLFQWTENEAPSFVPAAPVILAGSTGTSVKLSWIKPMQFTYGNGNSGAGIRCDHCSTTGSALQYAYGVKVGGGISNPTADSNVKNQHIDLLGPPNVEKMCDGNAIGAWSAASDGFGKDIYVDITFEHAIVPATYKVYVASSTDPIFLKSTFEDGTTADHGALNGGCSTARSLVVTTTKKLKELRITLKANAGTFAYPSLDAVAVISKDSQTTCASCPKIQYNVQRDGATIGSSTTRSFTDSTVKAGTTYKYKVQGTYTGATGKVSPWSAELTHTAGGAYCGNGVKDAGEDCDDGNSADGDGCSIVCKIEEGFYCDTAKNPSKCAVACGDGKCTAGEKLTCPKDCGYYEGEGEFNQWVKSATYSATATQPVAALTGIPTKFATCTKLGKDDAFMPKAAGFITAEFEAAVTPTAIEVYLTNDAAILTLSIFDTAGKEHVLPTNVFGAKCTTQPWRYSFPLSSTNRKDSLSRVYAVSMAPVFTKKVKVTIANGAAIGGHWDVDKVQITGIRLRSDTAALQAACSVLNGANSAWSSKSKACITAPSQTEYASCGVSKPVMAMKSCFSSNFCSAGGKLAACRTKCKWGAVTTEKTFDFTLKMTGVTKAQFGTDLQAAYKETMAESLQISTSKIAITSIMDISRRATQLRVLSKITMPNEAAATSAKDASNSLVTSGAFVKTFRAKSVAKGTYLPALSVASTNTITGGGPVPTPTSSGSASAAGSASAGASAGASAKASGGDVVSPAAPNALTKTWVTIVMCGAVVVLRGVLA